MLVNLQSSLLFFLQIYYQILESNLVFKSCIRSFRITQECNIAYCLPLAGGTVTCTCDLQLQRPFFFQRGLLADQRAQWHKTLLQALRESKIILANTNTKESQLNVYPYLCLLMDGEYVDIMIQVRSKRQRDFRRKRQCRVSLSVGRRGER